MCDPCQHLDMVMTSDGDQVCTSCGLVMHEHMTAMPDAGSGACVVDEDDAMIDKQSYRKREQRRREHELDCFMTTFKYPDTMKQTMKETLRKHQGYSCRGKNRVHADLMFLWMTIESSCYGMTFNIFKEQLLLHWKNDNRMLTMIESFNIGRMHNMRKRLNIHSIQRSLHLSTLQPISRKDMRLFVTNLGTILGVQYKHSLLASEMAHLMSARLQNTNLCDSVAMAIASLEVIFERSHINISRGAMCRRFQCKPITVQKIRSIIKL